MNSGRELERSRAASVAIVFLTPDLEGVLCTTRLTGLTITKITVDSATARAKAEMTGPLSPSGKTALGVRSGNESSGRSGRATAFTVTRSRSIPREEMAF